MVIHIVFIQYLIKYYLCNLVVNDFISLLIMRPIYITA